MCSLRKNLRLSISSPQGPVPSRTTVISWSGRRMRSRLVTAPWGLRAVCFWLALGLWIGALPGGSPAFPPGPGLSLGNAEARSHRSSTSDKGRDGEVRKLDPAFLDRVNAAVASRATLPAQLASSAMLIVKSRSRAALSPRPGGGGRQQAGRSARSAAALPRGCRSRPREHRQRRGCPGPVAPAPSCGWRGRLARRSRGAGRAR